MITNILKKTYHLLNLIAQSAKIKIFDPKLLDVFGPFEELVDEIALLLNHDFRNNPKLLPAVSKLSAGAIIHDKTTLFIISCEVYSRHTSIDTHAETNGGSLLIGTSVYPSISCSIISDSDGRKMKQKLITGTNTINFLSTYSTLIYHSPSISIGPQTLLQESAMTSAQARIYLQSDQVRAFKNCIPGYGV